MRHLIYTLAILATMVSCAGASEGVKMKKYEIEVIAEYPHDTTSYTQGLFFHDGKMYETTGQYGSSTMRIVDLTTGAPLKKKDFDSKYFVEGSVVLDGNMYLLTWDSWEAFIFDPETFEQKTSTRYSRQGWGITTDGKQLIASDGSATLFFMDKKYSLKRRLVVKMEGKPVKWLNELEYIDGRIWANVYMTDEIVIINPENGNVEGLVNCAGLLPKELRTPNTDVLNGIAQDPNTGKIYLTGKNWPKLYEVKLVEK